MRYVGMCLLFAAAALVSRMYERRQQQGRTQTDAMLRLLSALRREVACYAKPLGAFAATYTDEVLEQLSFLPVLREEGTLPEALRAAEERGCLSRPMCELLTRFAAAFGTGYREDELRAMDAVIDEAQALYRAEEEARPKRCRLCRTLCVSLALLLVLLFL